MAQSKHEKIERNVFLLIVLTLMTVSVGGLVEIVPLFFQHSTMKAIDQKGNELQVKPYSPLRLAGRDIYIREGCSNCHSQMIRPFRAETERYGHYSVAGESIYDHPFLWGSKRTGPDLARVGGRYSDEWQRVHLINPRDVVPESNMPAFPWLDRPLNDDIQAKMRALGWKPRIEWEEGIRATVRWFAAHQDWMERAVARGKAYFEEWYRER